MMITAFIYAHTRFNKIYLSLLWELSWHCLICLATWWLSWLCLRLIVLDLWGGWSTVIRWSQSRRGSHVRCQICVSPVWLRCLSFSFLGWTGWKSLKTCSLFKWYLLYNYIYIYIYWLSTESTGQFASAGIEQQPDDQALTPTDTSINRFNRYHHASNSRHSWFTVACQLLTGSTR